MSRNPKKKEQQFLRDLPLLAVALEENRAIQDGEVMFRGLGLSRIEPAIEYGFPFKASVPRILRGSLVRKAAFSAGSAGTITADSLKAALHDTQESYLKKPEQPYCLATSLLIRPKGGAMRWQSGHCRLTLRPNLPKQFARKHVADALPANHFLSDDGHLKALIHTRGRCEHDGFEKAMNALDFIRGCWILAQDARLHWSWSSDESRPFSDFALGAIHTIHHPGGASASDLVWHELPAGVSKPRLAKAPNWASLRAEVASIRKDVRKSKFSQVLTTCIQRLPRALDRGDAPSALLKLWGIVEVLTDTVGGRYDDTIRRSLGIYRDDELALQTANLESHREARNSIAHAGLDSVPRERVEHLKMHTIDLLSFALTHGMRFQSLAEMNSVLAAGRDATALKSRMRIAQEALSLQRRRQSSP